MAKRKKADVVEASAESGSDVASEPVVVTADAPPAVDPPVVEERKPYVFSRHSAWSMKVFRESPLKWRRMFVEGIMDDDSKKHYEFGKAFAIHLLEPHRKDRILVADLDRRKTADKVVWAEAKRLGKIIISTEEDALIPKMIDAVCANEEAARILSHPGAKREQKMEWDCLLTGLPMKARLDVDIDDELLIADVKTTDKPLDPESFGRDCYEYDYHVQDAMYVDGKEAVTGKKGWRFLHIVVCKNPKFGIEAMVCELSPRAVMVGRQVFFNTAEDLKVAMQYDSFSSPWTIGIQPVDLPGWAYSKLRNNLPWQMQVQN